MVGGIGWQGIVPSRAAKIGSLAVDSGISKIGTPREFFKELDPEQIAQQIVVSTREDIREIVDSITAREQAHPAYARFLTDQVLEAQPEVLDAIKRVSRAKTTQRLIHLTPFGRDFCDVCLQLDAAEVQALTQK